MKIMNSKSLNLPKLQILFDMKISLQEFNKWTLAYCWHFSSASKKKRFDLVQSRLHNHCYGNMLLSQYSYKKLLLRKTNGNFCDYFQSSSINVSYLIPFLYVVNFSAMGPKILWNCIKMFYYYRISQYIISKLC